MEKKTQQSPRGLRNNNPGNIEKSDTTFQGEVPSTDTRFKTFSSMAYGYRALLRVLTTYQTKYHLETIRQWISRWAPPVENDTEAYIAYVVQQTGIPDNRAISVNNKVDMCSVAAAISSQENGVPADMADVLAGWGLLCGR